MWDMSKSEVCRELIHAAIEDEPDALDLADEFEVRHWSKQREQDQLQKQGKIEDMRGGWRGRVRSRLNGRLAGEEPYPPEVIEDLSDLYWQEIEIWEDDEQLIAGHRQWFDQLLEDYRDAYRAKQHYPSDGFDSVDDAVEIGSELERIRPQLDEILARLESKAESKQAVDPEAIIQSIAGDYGVSSETVETLLDMAVPDDVDQRRVLKDADRALDKDLNQLPAASDERATDGGKQL